jgi:hypothetical protein
MPIKGFDYRTGLEVQKLSRAWRADMIAVVAEGGYRRVENGETFVHGKDGRIAFEVYGYLPKVTL